MTSPTPRGKPVTDEDVSKAVAAYEFVLRNRAGPLKSSDQWWEESTQKRRMRDGSEKQFDWLGPFMSLEVAQHEALRPTLKWGPRGAEHLIKGLRSLVRARRKAKEDPSDLLQALYGACLMADLHAALEFEGMPSHAMTTFVALGDLPTLHRDLRAVQHRPVKSLSVTDRKWLKEAFGEPAVYEPFDALVRPVREAAIARYCWCELGFAHPPEQAEQRMRDWLGELVRRNIGYLRGQVALAAASVDRYLEVAHELDGALAATLEPFIVADLETTGLNAETDEILEFAAVAVNAMGVVTGEFQMLVKVRGPIQPIITGITGLRQLDVELMGRSLDHAYNSFLTFVGALPVFFHNAPFDEGFLAKASARTAMPFKNAVYDTLPLARQAWPDLNNHKLGTLAQHVGAPAPTHRGLADAKAALAVLLAARDIVSPMHAARKALAADLDEEIFGPR